MQTVTINHYMTDPQILEAINRAEESGLILSMSMIDLRRRIVEVSSTRALSSKEPWDGNLLFLPKTSRRRRRRLRGKALAA